MESAKFATKDIYQNFKILTQCLENTHNKCIKELAKDTFSFTFPCFFVINMYE